MNHDQHEAWDARSPPACTVAACTCCLRGLSQPLVYFSNASTTLTIHMRHPNGASAHRPGTIPQQSHHDTVTVSRAHAMEAHKRPNRRPKRPVASRATPPAGPRAAQPVWTPAVPPRDRKLANRAAHARPRPLLAVLVSPSPTDLAARKRHRRWNSRRRSTCHGYRGCRNTVSNAAGHAAQATGR